jgi:hypothetical protein
MIKGKKWVMGGKELWHQFFLEKALDFGNLYQML